jgi:hypothetical protein
MSELNVPKEELTTTPLPFHLIVSYPLFLAIKNNQGLKPDSKEVLKESAEEFEKFKSLFKTFLDLLNNHQESAFSILSTIMSIWGYSRKYCGMCGKPIIGKPGHIENRMVCQRCNESFRIAEELYKRDPHDLKQEALKEFTERKREEKSADRTDIPPLSNSL